MCSDIKNKNLMTPTHSSTYVVNIEWFASGPRDLEMSASMSFLP